MTDKKNSSDFKDILDRGMTRRGFLGNSAAFGVGAFVMSSASLSTLVSAASDKGSSLFSFEAVAATSADTITLPKGYTWSTLISWGDPLFSKGTAFDQKTRGDGSSQELAFGDNNDGMALFALSATTGVMAVNNEYINKDIMFPNDATSADDIRKSKAGHGVSVFEVENKDGQWKPLLDSQYNRRITADTPMDITGPARGHDLLKTLADPTGTQSLGTWNNCGNGRTPWGTYLACEENFNGYFASSDPKLALTAEQKRYGIPLEDRGYNWISADERFDISKHPNESNRAGYIVEIDPMDPNSTPKKRTALGRFKHENAEVVVANNGHVVVYLGDDERGEFLYRFVSKNKYKSGDDTNNRNLLEEGTLYVAKFGEAGDKLAGKGEWIELTQGKNGLTKDAGFASQADICIHTRQAGSAVKATTMDRPEWVAVNPNKVEAYCALTNNKNRAKKPNAGGDDTPLNGPNPRAENLYGQIVRWTPSAEDHTAATFDWDLYVVAGNPTVHKNNLNAGSPNITPDNMFNSPDGIAFDKGGRLWIQTDGKYSNKDGFAGMGNNQMLCADPMTGEIRRFMVGPVACEVTGITWTEDQKTMFVGIQHPGEKEKPSHFPDGGDTVPRSSVVVITREDGGIVGA